MVVRASWFGLYEHQPVPGKLETTIPTQLTEILHGYHPAQMFTEIVTSTLTSYIKYIIYVNYCSNSDTPLLLQTKNTDIGEALLEAQLF